MRRPEALWTHPRLREIYPEFLFRNHSVIRSSVPLMQAAAAACEKMLDSDPIAEGMLAYFRKHIPEETGHDDWVLDDLETLGFRPRGSVEAHTSAVGGGAGRRAILLDPARPSRSAAGFHCGAGGNAAGRRSFSRIRRTASGCRGALSATCCCTESSIPSTATIWITPWTLCR